MAEPTIELADLDTVAREADFLCVHTPLDATTHHLVDADVIGRMKPGGYVVNTARGGVVDESALYDALVSGHLAGAALDVHGVLGGDPCQDLARWEYFYRRRGLCKWLYEGHGAPTRGEARRMKLALGHVLLEKIAWLAGRSDAASMRRLATDRERAEKLLRQLGVLDAGEQLALVTP